LSPSNQGNQVLAHDSEDNEAAAVKIQVGELICFGKESGFFSRFS